MKLKKKYIKKKCSQAGVATRSFLLNKLSNGEISSYKRILKIIIIYLKKRKKINFVNPPQDLTKIIKFFNQIKVHSLDKNGLTENAQLKLLTKNDLTVWFLGFESSPSLKMLNKYRSLRLPVLTVVKASKKSGDFVDASTKIGIFNHVLTKHLKNAINVK